jgi:NAD(P)-dependent dehydrogenase (short-subunit alcohol dehydrogenase family)
MGELNDKLALITGGAGGLGWATAAALAARGATVVATDVDDAVGQELYGQLGRPHSYRHLDVSDSAAWQTLADEVIAEHGGVDILFLNAGVMTRPKDAPVYNDPLVWFEVEAYRRLMSINLDGVMYGLIAVLPGLRDGAQVVITSSVAGLEPLSFDPFYSIAKYALVGVVRSLAKSFGRRGISINAVCPGGIDTGIIAPDLRKRTKLSPPGYIAEAVLQIIASGESGQAWLAQEEGQTPLPYAFQKVRHSVG